MTGSFPTGNDKYGNCVAISADGKKIIVGAIDDETVIGNFGSGLTYVYNRIGNSFNQVGILTGSNIPGTQFGSYVATSADGKSIIVGSQQGNSSVDNTGCAFVFDEVKETYLHSNTQGNIGIGTSNPTSKLSVNGTVTATSFVGNGSGLTGISFPEGTFTQIGSGAITRTVSSKFNEIVSVKDFGAVGDPSVDDTAAFQAALNAHSAIYVPRGTYYISATLTKANSDLTLYGDGSDASILAFTGGTNGLNWTASTDAFKLSLEGLQFRSDTTTMAIGVSAIITPDEGRVFTNVSIEDVLVSREEGSANSWVKGFYFYNCRNIAVSESTFNGKYGTSTHGFDCDGQSLDARFYACQVNDCGTAFRSGGITEGTLIANCLAINIDTAVDKVHTIGINPLEPLISITNSHFNSRVNGVILQNVQQSFISGNLFYAFAGAAMPGWTGITISGPNSGYINISNNVFHGPNYTGSRTGVSIVQGIHNNLLENFFLGIDTAVSFGTNSSYCTDRFSSHNVVTTQFTDTGSNNVRISTRSFESLFSTAGPPLFTLEDRSGPANNKSASWYNGAGILKLYHLNDNGSIKQIGGRFSPDTITLGGDLNAESLRLNVGSYANHITINGSSAGISPSVGAEGTDTNINLELRVKGNGSVFSTNSLLPSIDNLHNLGGGSYRWSTVFAGTGTINTSDGRDKQDIEGLDAAEKRVAVTLKGLVKKFRFKDAVNIKGEEARIHIGVITQDVIAAFTSEGLDAYRYGIVCYDEWNEIEEIQDENGKIVKPYRPAGNRYGIRYEELLAFIIASL